MRRPPVTVGRKHPGGVVSSCGEAGQEGCLCQHRGTRWCWRAFELPDHRCGKGSKVLTGVAQNSPPLTFDLVRGIVGFDGFDSDASPPRAQNSSLDLRVPNYRS